MRKMLTASACALMLTFAGAMGAAAQSTAPSTNDASKNGSEAAPKGPNRVEGDTRSQAPGTTTGSGAIHHDRNKMKSDRARTDRNLQK